jgi:hypothetical protein
MRKGKAEGTSLACRFLYFHKDATGSDVFVIELGLFDSWEEEEGILFQF